MKSKKQTLEKAPDVDLPPSEGRANKREDTRSQIALYYVLGFLFVICLCFVVTSIAGLSVRETGDLLVSVSGILSGPLGFIIGYYFKSHTDKAE